MKLQFIRFTIACCGLSLVACAAPPSQEQTGTVLGGALGGVLEVWPGLRFFSPK